MSYCHPHRQQETYLSDSNTRQRWFLWKKCLFSLKQWYLSSGSASFSLRRNSSSFKPVLCLKYNKQHSLFRIYSVFSLKFSDSTYKQINSYFIYRVPCQACFECQGRDEEPNVLSCVNCCDRLKLPNYVKIGMFKFFFPPLTLNKQTNMILPFSIQITQQSNIKQQRVNLRLYHVQYKSSCHLHHFIVTYDFNGHFCACPGLVSTSYYITEHTMACIPIHCITLVQHLSYTHSYRTKMYDRTIRTRNQNQIIISI